MPKAVKIFVRSVEAVNTVVGKFSMYLVFGMMGVLLFESISRTIFNKPHIWVVEVAQFTMAAYYLLGGGYSMILEGHVRMDLLYGRWSEKKKAVVDLFTGLFLIFYLVF
ncbi:MAG: TRAP transporter small permease subunit, partial [Deltaproteobacteria bacterium]|nr:TRAP transporter small permease subunit [Deltaproteobacteria bacterium]